MHHRLLASPLARVTVHRGGLPLAATFAIAVGCGGAAKAPTAPSSAAVAEVCIGIPEDADRTLPIYSRELVAGVAPLRGPAQVGKVTYERLAGASVRLRSAPGITAPWLQRSFDCHLARLDAGRVASTTAASDPLAPPSGRARVVVKTGATGYEVEITGDSRQASEEILTRARALAPGSAATN